MDSFNFSRSGGSVVVYTQKSVQTRAVSVAVSGLLLTSLLMTTPRIKADDANFGWGIFGGIAAVIGTALATASLCGFFSKTDEQVYEAGQLDLRNLKPFYADINGFCKLHHVISPSTTVSDLVYYESEELDRFAAELRSRGTTAQAYLKKLYEVITALRTDLDTIVERIYALENKPWNERNDRLLKQMYMVRDEIQDMLPYATLYYNFLNAHIAFFHLYDELYHVAAKYRQEISAYKYHFYDPIRLAYAIKQAVGSHTNLTGSFRLLAYAKMLNDDLGSVQNAIKALKFSYPILYSTANKSVDFFKHIRGVLLADPDYADECYEYQLQLQRDKNFHQMERLIDAQQEANRIHRQMVKVAEEQECVNVKVCCY
jgi:hypothetical protein